jgi:ubiquinone/menaquinone biosynthesis C-methylase UbiE
MSKALTEKDEKFIRATTEREFRQSEDARLGHERILNHLRDNGALSPYSRILDLGCGTGRLCTYLTIKGFDTYGIDIDSNLIKLAKGETEKRCVQCNFAVGEAESLPFRNGYFDICLATSVLEHVADWQMTLKEVNRVLKPGGVFYIETTNRWYPFQSEIKYFLFYSYLPLKFRKRIMDYIVEKHPKLIDYGPCPAYHWFTYTGLRRELIKAGFREIADVIDMLTPQSPVRRRYRWALRLVPILKRLTFLRSLFSTALPMVILCAKK